MKTLKKLILIGIGLSFASNVGAQIKLRTNTEKDIPYYKNEVGLEVGGNSLIYSAYYQRALYRKGNTQFNIRVGGSFLPNMDDYNYGNRSHNFNLMGYIIPNVLFFQKRHAWEVGLGVNVFANFHKETYYNNSQNRSEYIDNSQLYFLTPQIGYRAYLKNSKFYFRTAFSTFIYVLGHETGGERMNVEPQILPWGALGFGYNF